MELVSQHVPTATPTATGTPCTLHALVAGQGEPILCISGFGCSSYNFDWMWPVLAGRRQAVLLDNRGMGLSSHVRDPYELEDLAADGVAVMKGLGHQRFHVIGISMGGMIAQLLALAFPENVLSLSLLCTSSGGSGFLPLPPLTPDMLRKYYQIPEPARTDLTMQGLVHPSLMQGNPTKYQAILHLRRTNPADMEQLLLQKAAVDRFLDKDSPLEDIRCPTFILSGDSDRFVAPENSRRLQERIPHSRLYIVPSADHYFFLEKAEEVATRIGEFFDSITDHRNAGVSPT